MQDLPYFYAAYVRSPAPRRPLPGPATGPEAPRWPNLGRAPRSGHCHAPRWRRYTPSATRPPSDDSAPPAAPEAARRRRSVATPAPFVHPVHPLAPRSHPDACGLCTPCSHCRLLRRLVLTACSGAAPSRPPLLRPPPHRPGAAHKKSAAAGPCTGLATTLASQISPHTFERSPAQRTPCSHRSFTRSLATSPCACAPANPPAQPHPAAPRRHIFTTPGMAYTRALSG